ncbi:MAG: M81 family metallopeptidase [Pseudomonadota bacterium]
MKLFIATLSTETNTFSTMPTARSGFEEYFFRHGDATKLLPNLMTEALHVWRSKAEERGWEVVESIAAIAEPAGPTISACYDALRSEMLDDLKEAGNIDIVLLQLHGAMVAEHVEDCEGDIVSEIRKLCPGAVIGMALDLHCHLTNKMLENSDIIICFKEYPHDDATDRAVELFDLAHQTASGTINPVIRDFDCRMVNLYLTKNGRMQKFVERMSETENEPGILSVSLAHGFPWGDVADVGARMLVVADDDPELAASTAQILGREFFALRNEVTQEFHSISDALDEIDSGEEGPIVLADMGDNSGGGAPGDSTYMLSKLLDHKLSDIALGIIWDPVAVRICEDAQTGAELNLRIGGKTAPESGSPVDLAVKVMNIKSGIGQHLGNGLEPLGTVVWLRASDNFDILINNLRTQVYHPEAFEQLGIDLAQKSVVAVKSLFHFYAPFEKIAAKVIQVATPGGTCPDFRSIKYTKRDGNYWPNEEDPFEKEPFP